MKLLSSPRLEAQSLILLSAVALALLTSVGATPLPLALGTDTAVVSRAATIDPSHLVVTSGRGLSENAGPGLTSRFSDFLTARDSTIPLTRRGNYDGLPILRFGEAKGPRPSLEALGNPIQELFTKELEKKIYNVKNPGEAVRMLRLDLLFALAEETGFVIEDGNFLNPSLDTKLTDQIEKDLEAFSKKALGATSKDFGAENLAEECLIRVRYLKAVFKKKDQKTIVVTEPEFPPQIPGCYFLGEYRYIVFLQKKIRELEGDDETQEDRKLILKRRIMRLGLRYNLIREVDFNGEIRRPAIRDFEVDLEYFEKLGEEAGTEAEVRECKARAKYYHDLFLEVV
ncbi:hypothetical protein H0H93_010919 [Arthromyces matolae]|nr:hypothetical protein H0H93_010919 [Arthromyces matolae]